MDMQSLANIVQTLGFPIVTCGACFWYVKYITDTHREDQRKLQEDYNQIINSTIEALNNNTKALTELTDQLKV